MESFSSLVKKEISVIDNKPKICCCFASLYGAFCFSTQKNANENTIVAKVMHIDYFQKIFESLNVKKKIFYSIDNKKIVFNNDLIRYSVIEDIEANVFKCPNCKESFIKGLFLTHGTISDPHKLYRMDLSFNSKLYAEQILSWFNSFDLSFKITKRRNNYILYTKNSDSISDFLALVGAKNSVYEIINSKIEKELRNDVNRATNCDSANINKTVTASQKYCVVIDNIIKENLFDELPEELQETAKIRLEFDNLNFTDLGKKFNPQISKSGVYHRLEKIVSFYDNFKKSNKE